MKTKVIIVVLLLILVGGVYGGIEAAKQKKNSTNNASLGIKENTTQKVTDPIIDDQEGLQVVAQWEKQENPSREQIFLINLNNHDIDLDDFKFEGNVKVLIDDKEIPIHIEVLEREGLGHHLSAKLKIKSQEFSKASSGSRLTLNVENVYNTPTRSFSWHF